MKNPHFPAGIYPILDLDACQARSVAPEEVILEWKTLGWGPFQLRAKGVSAQEYAALAEKLHAVWMEPLPMQAPIAESDSADQPDSTSAATGSMGGHPNRWFGRPAIIANDFLELAWHHSDWFCGIHLGQSDLESLSSREQAMLQQILDSGGIAGCSTHNLDQFRRAMEPDESPFGKESRGSVWSYIALGPVFATGSKTKSSDQNDPLGPEQALEIIAESKVVSQFEERSRPFSVVMIGGLNPENWAELAKGIQTRGWNTRAFVPAVIGSVMNSGPGADGARQWDDSLRSLHLDT